MRSHPPFLASRRLFPIVLALLLVLATVAQASLTWTYNAATDVPVTTKGYTASGTATLALNFAPTPGTTLMVVNNGALDFINGTFSNLAQGQAVPLSYNGITYHFVANYYGGNGNDLVLEWAAERLLAWGNNFYGVFGNGSNTSSSVPVPVDSTGVLAGKTIVAAGEGFYHSLVLCSDGTLASWGFSPDGELGNGGNAPVSVPGLVSTSGGSALAGKTVVAISAGLYHSLALCADGTVAAWGRGYSGELGNGSLGEFARPVAVSTSAGSALAGKSVSAISAGGTPNGSYSLALCSDGTIAAWGYNGEGELGNSSTTESNVPVLVSTAGVLAGKAVVAIAAGDGHSLALCSDGTLVAWGANDGGQLGNNSTTSSSVPVLVSTDGVLAGKTVVAIAAGGYHSVALCSDGTLASWGYNGYGTLGNNSTDASSVPVLIDTSAGSALAGKTVTAIATTLYTSLALCSDGSLTAWGYNYDGQLGDGTTTTAPTYGKLTPVLVSTAALATGERWSLVGNSSSSYHILALAAAPPWPVEGTLAASSITATSATLNGVVIAGNYTASVSFDYGTTTSYGTTVAGTPSPVTGTSTTAVSAAITGLSPGVIYHFRVNVASSYGASSGNDVTFTTASTIAATWNAATDVPVTASSFTASSGAINLSLNFAPVPGTTLTVVKNTGLGFINGTFSNLAQGQAVTLTYNGTTYNFVANYYGGTGNDLVLVWQNTRAFGWGSNGDGQLGTNGPPQSNIPVAMDATGVLAGKTVISVAAGAAQSLVLCSDGTLAACGYNGDGELGNYGPPESTLPMAVNTTSGVSALFGKTVVAVAAGYDHSVALCSDGTVATWGGNQYGQLGDNSTTNRQVPVAVNTTSGVSALFGKTVVAISAGDGHSVALCSDGTVVTWGFNGNGQLGNNSNVASSVPVAVNTDSGASALFGKTVVAIAAGGFHTLALCADGTVAAWGYNYDGELGDGTTTTSSPYGKLVPVAVNTASGVSALFGKTVVAITGSYEHSLAVCSDGSVAAWGLNQYGELGDNSTTSRRTPVAVNTVSGVSALFGKTVVAVSAGYQYSVALTSDGTVAAWGYNGEGELGDNSTTQRNVPVAVNSTPLTLGERFAALFKGSISQQSLALVAEPPPASTTLTATSVTGNSAILNGTVNAYGHSTAVTFDYGTTASYGTNVAATPSQATGTSDTAVNTVLSGLTLGTTYHFRVNGVNSIGTSRGSDLTVTTLNDVTATFNAATDVPLTVPNFTAAGGTLSLALNFAPTPGTSLTVVNNTGPALINGAFSNLAQGQAVPLTYNGVTYHFVANYYGGNGNDLVLEWAAERLLAWGNNFYGVFGNGSNTSSSVPVPVDSTGVLAGKTIVAAGEGFYHSLVLCSDGTLASWGFSPDGELGNGGNAPVSVPGLVSTSGGSALAGKTVVAISAGLYHSLALCADGTVAAWGRGYSGELGNGSLGEFARPVAVSTSAGSALAGKSVSAISAGGTPNGSYSLALCSDGTIAAWGYNGEGELGNNSTTESNVPVLVSTAGVLAGKAVVAIAAGDGHSLALCSDGTLVAWGANDGGQLGNNSTTSSSVPVLVSTDGVLAGKTVVAIAAGGYHSLALCSDGTLASWGYNGNGTLGNNSTDASSVPVLVDTSPGSALAGKTVTAIATTLYTSLALCSDGSLTAWGYNYDGQLGDGTTTTAPTYGKLTPVLVSTAALATGERWSLVGNSSSSYHILALAAAPVATPLQSWRQTWFGTTANSGNAADAADPYGIGLTNLNVFAFFGPNQNPTQAQVSLLPQPQTSGGNLFFSFNQPAGVSGITYGAQWSTTLLPNDWHAITDTGTGNAHLFSMPIGGNAKLFIRLNVSEP